MMTERIILLVAITLLLMMVLTLLKKQQLKRAQSMTTAPKSTSGKTCNTKPQLIYFWSTQCSQCKSIQAPVVDNLPSVIGQDKFTITKYNINESPEQAINWGVKTVPSIYLLDRTGKVQHINNGLTTEKMLREQIETLVV